MAAAQFMRCTYQEIIDNADLAIMSAWFLTNTPTEEMFLYAAKSQRPEALNLLLRDFHASLLYVSNSTLHQINEAVVEHDDETFMSTWFVRHRPTEQVISYAVKERHPHAVKLLLRDFRDCISDDVLSELLAHSLCLIFNTNGQISPHEIYNRGEREKPKLRNGKTAKLDLSIVQQLLQAGVRVNEHHLMIAIRRGQHKLVYMLLHAGALDQHLDRDSIERVALENLFDVQSAGDANARSDLHNAALKIASILVAFVHKVPAGIIDFAHARGQQQVARVLETARTQKGSFRYVLHVLKQNRIPASLRFHIGAFLFSLPEDLRPRHVRTDANQDSNVLNENVTCKAAVFDLLGEVCSAADPVQSARALVKEVFLLFESFPLISSLEIRELLQHIAAAIQDSTTQVARSVYDEFNFRTPSLEFVAKECYKNDGDLSRQVCKFLAVLKAARTQRKRKSEKSGELQV